MIRKGGTIAGYTMQPDRTVTVKADGAAEGTVYYECDRSALSSLPRLYSGHPDDPTLIAHNIEYRFIGLQKIRATYTYFGLTASYSGDMRTIEFDGGADQVPIQLHPKFASFAGTPESPQNGAIWVDAMTGLPTKQNANAIFRGFGPDSKYAGLEFYLAARPTVTRTWYSRSAANLPSAGTITNSVPGVGSVPGIKNWLCLGGSYRKTGAYYQISVQYKGSPDPGWNRDIYG